MRITGRSTAAPERTLAIVLSLSLVVQMIGSAVMGPVERICPIMTAGCDVLDCIGYARPCEAQCPDATDSPCCASLDTTHDEDDPKDERERCDLSIACCLGARGAPIMADPGVALVLFTTERIAEEATEHSVPSRVIEPRLRPPIAS